MPLAEIGEPQKVQQFRVFWCELLGGGQLLQGAGEVALGVEGLPHLEVVDGQVPVGLTQGAPRGEQDGDGKDEGRGTDHIPHRKPAKLRQEKLTDVMIVVNEKPVIGGATDAALQLPDALEMGHVLEAAVARLDLGVA